jgi:hypothetical protein
MYYLSGELNVILPLSGGYKREGRLTVNKQAA